MHRTLLVDATQLGCTSPSLFFLVLELQRAALSATSPSCAEICPRNRKEWASPDISPGIPFSTTPRKKSLLYHLDAMKVASIAHKYARQNLVEALTVGNAVSVAAKRDRPLFLPPARVIRVIITIKHCNRSQIRTDCGIIERWCTYDDLQTIDEIFRSTEFTGRELVSARQHHNWPYT